MRVWVPWARRARAICTRIRNTSRPGTQRLVVTPGKNQKHYLAGVSDPLRQRFVGDLLLQMGGKIRLHFLPPYCPNENRIERLWQDLHANVTRNHRCRTMRALLANVLHWLDARFSTEEEYALAA